MEDDRAHRPTPLPAGFVYPVFVMRRNSVLCKASFLALSLLVFSQKQALCGVCPTKGAIIFVETQERRLYLCENSEIVNSYRVALGRGGIGKHTHGDNKTPLGSYRLDSPRASERFHLFIPIGYPTSDQKKHGYSGDGVGIHGPVRYLKWLGR